MSTPSRHLTAREKATEANRVAALARANAHLPPPAAEPPEPWPPSPAAWRTRCRHIRLEIEATRD